MTYPVAICMLAALLLFAGCAAKKEVVRQPKAGPYTGPVTIEVLKQSVGFRDIRTIKALVDVKVFRKGEPAGSFNGVLGYKAPDAVKTSFFGPFGLTVMEMLATKDVLQVYVPPKNILYETLSPGISLSSLRNDDRFLYVMQEEGDFHALYVYNAADTTEGPLMKYLFDRTFLLNRKIIVYRSAEEAMTISFGDFDGTVPGLSRISFSNGTDMEITFQEPEYDTEIPDAYFREIEHGDKQILPFQELLKRFAPRR
ncbi:MAG: hypothetical protein FIA94_14735 [Nitrospirae bacterium]|nr:hypothetical protein [Nitrospirota bacterium]